MPSKQAIRMAERTWMIRRLDSDNPGAMLDSQGHIDDLAAGIDKIIEKAKRREAKAQAAIDDAADVVRKARSAIIKLKTAINRALNEPHMAPLKDHIREDLKQAASIPMSHLVIGESN